jgi:large subunit ribosomal protein L23
MNPHLLIKPIITEKSMQLANESNVYTFGVDRRANKNQIKVTIEDVYNVNVLAVNTVMNQVENIRTGRKRSVVKTAKQKKAFVKIKPGQVIDIFDLSSEAKA